MTQPSTTHRATIHHTTQRLYNMPQGGRRQKPAIHNNVTQQETPQPNENYTTPRNTTQWYTTQPTTTKKHMTRHGKANARHNTTPPTPHDTTQNMLRRDATTQPSDTTRPDTILRGTTRRHGYTLHHVTNRNILRKQGAATHHDITRRNAPPVPTLFATALPHG